jgi:hypothetical protein
VVGLLEIITPVTEEQESDGQLERLCSQQDDMGTVARAYRAATTAAERQVFAETLLIFWHRTAKERNIALHGRLIRDAAL